jgi:hypothetical protein
MTKYGTLSTPMGLLLIAIMLMSIMKLTRAAPSSGLMADALANDDDTDVQEQRRSSYHDQLRRFLLTSNAEQRAARREQQEFNKRELVNRLYFL